MLIADFNATEEFAEAHWVEVFGGNGGYAGSFRLNPAYQVLTAERSSLCQDASAQPAPVAALPAKHLLSSSAT